MIIDNVSRDEKLMKGFYEFPTLETLRGVVRSACFLSAVDVSLTSANAEGEQRQEQSRDWRKILAIDPKIFFGYVLSLATSGFPVTENDVFSNTMRRMSERLNGDNHCFALKGQVQLEVLKKDGSYEPGEEIQTDLFVRTSPVNNSDFVGSFQVDRFNFLELAAESFNLYQAAYATTVVCRLLPNRKTSYTIDLAKILSAVNAFIPLPSDMQDIAKISTKVARDIRDQYLADKPQGKLPVSFRAEIIIHSMDFVIPLRITINLIDVEVAGVSGSTLHCMQIRNQQGMPLVPVISFEFMQIMEADDDVIAIAFTRSERTFINTTITDIVAALRA